MTEGSGDLVGRQAECGRILAALAPLRARGAAALVLRGPPGVGKSALLEWTVAQLPACEVLSATGTLREMHAPFSLLDTLLPGRDADDAGTGGRERAPTGVVLGGNGPADRFQVAMAVFGRLSSLAESKPVLVVVDDAQWADHSSLDALLLARTHLEGDPVAMVFAQRDGEPCALDRVDLPTLNVAGLSSSAACALLDGAVAPAVARRLAQHTDGNPLALLELADGLDPDQRAGRAPLAPWLLRTPTVEAGFARRVDTLPPDLRRALELASIDSAIEPAVLRAITGAPPGTDPIAPLVEAGFLRLDHRARVVEFTHPLLRTAVYQAMDPDDRANAHRRLAEMLRRDDDLTRRAWHLAGASRGLDDYAADELARAGDYSHARSAYGVAARTFERSAELTTDAGVRTGRLLAAGDAYWLAGQIQESALVLDYALTLAPDQCQRADVQLKRITTQRTRPSVEMFEELIREAQATEGADRERAALLYAQAVMSGMMGMQLDRTLGSAERALDLLDPANPMTFVARLLRALVMNLLGRHREALPAFRQLADMLDTVGPSVQMAGLAEYTALALLAGDDFATASRILDTMIDFAREERALGLLPLPLAARAELRWRAGSWAAALADATESYAIVNETQQHIERSLSLLVLGKIQGGVGRFDEAHRLLREALATADERRSAGLRYMASSARGFVNLTAGDHPAALQDLLVCLAYARSSGDADPTLWLWRPDLVEVATRTGRRALAKEVSAQFDAEAEQQGSNQAQALADRTRALVTDDETEMRHTFAAALERFETLPFPFERARTQLLYGEQLLARGRGNEATAPLTGALDAFDDLGAHPWSARARSHLAPREQTIRSTIFEQLTERELQVAMAVSTGKTSAETANDLFLSRRTVEHHLAVVYRKLGIRNRTQLAALVNNPAAAARVHS